MKLNFWQVVGLVLLLSYGAYKVYTYYNPPLKDGKPAPSTQATYEAK